MIRVLVESVVGSRGRDAEPDESFAEEKQEGYFSGPHGPFAGRKFYIVRFLIHRLQSAR